MQDPVKFQILYLVLFLWSLELFLPQPSPLCIFFYWRKVGRPGFNSCIGKVPWRRERLPTPVFWPGELHGQRSLAGYCPLSQRIRHNWVTFTFIADLNIMLVSGVQHSDLVLYIHTCTVYSFSDSFHFFHYSLYYKILRASQMAQWERICLSMQGTQETQVWSLGQEDPLEEEMATHSSVLAWEITCTEEPGWLQFMG